MNENTVVISVSEYDRLRQIERESKPIHSRTAQPQIAAEPDRFRELGTSPLTFCKPVTFLQGPHQRGVVCRNCGCDMWLLDDFDDPMCGSCGLYVDSGIKVVSVERP